MTDRLEVDIHEPLTIKRLLEQSVEADWENLNEMGFADYRWYDLNDLLVQWERKTVAEVAGGSSRARASRQLLTQLHTNGRIGLIVEGIMAPSLEGIGVAEYPHLRWKYLRKTLDLQTPYNTLLGWFASLLVHGIPIMFTANEAATATLLVALYNKSRKDSSELFSRITIPEVEHDDPNVRTLLGIARAHPELMIGNKKAEAIIAKFPTIDYICRSTAKSIATVEGVGLVTAKRLLEVLGGHA